MPDRGSNSVQVGFLTSKTMLGHLCAKAHSKSSLFLASILSVPFARHIFGIHNSSDPPRVPTMWAKLSGGLIGLLGTQPSPESVKTQTKTTVTGHILCFTAKVAPNGAQSFADSGQICQNAIPDAASQNAPILMTGMRNQKSRTRLSCCKTPFRSACIP